MDHQSFSFQFLSVDISSEGKVFGESYQKRGRENRESSFLRENSLCKTGEK